MQITLNQQFRADLELFGKAAARWGAEAPRRLKTAHRKIGALHRQEAVKRVPVDEGTLRQRILTNTYETDGMIFTETGTNIPEYPIYIEFGTKYIAGGRVKRLGTAPDLTDAQAITLWPAKNFGSLVDFLGGSKDRRPGQIDEETGKANERIVAGFAARLARGGAQEQMPWLRPAFQKIKVDAIGLLHAAMDPPGAGQGVAV